MSCRTRSASDGPAATGRRRAPSGERSVGSASARRTVGDGASVSTAVAASAEKGDEKFVRVVCRLRPLFEREKKNDTNGNLPAVSASTERREVAVMRRATDLRGQQAPPSRHTFHFDDVLSSCSTQEDVFEATLAPLVRDLLAGYETTAFAYGQTGTGKTYTMEGDLETQEGRGLVPRAAAAIIGALQGGKYIDYSITVSYLEIYNEELSDLLAPSHLQQQRLDLKDVGNGKGVVCVGLSETAVMSVEEILALVHTAQERRRVAETRVNARSSRSHSIFTMKVRCKMTVEHGEIENNGKLHLVDLAGSECAKKASEEASPTDVASRRTAQALPEEERERKNINQSLLTLGRVITALRDQNQTVRVPYRDSKLTRLLQDALGGRCKTVLIATVSPAHSAVEETLSTLTYAEQAEGIKNKPVASSLLRSYRMAASGGCEGVRGGGISPTAIDHGLGSADWAALEMKVCYWKQEAEEAQARLAQLHRQVQEHAERATAAEEQMEKTELELQVARRSLEEGAFVRGRLSAFADQQQEAATQLSASFDAAAAHGEHITKLLQERAVAAANSRRQARDLCEAMDAADAGHQEEVEKGAQEVDKLIAEAHAAHRNHSNISADMLQDHQRIFRDYVTCVRASCTQLEDAIGVVAADCQEVLDGDLAATLKALDEIDSQTASARAAAVRVTTEVQAAVESGKQAIEDQAGAFREEVEAKRATLSAMAGAASSNLQVKKVSAERAHAAALGRMEHDVRAPLAHLHGLLQATTQSSEVHSTEVGALQAQAAEDVKSATEQQLGVMHALQEAIGSLGASLAARPSSVARALVQLGDALAARGQALGASLAAADAGLNRTQTSLAQASERGQEGLLSSLGAAETELGAAWKAEAAALDELQALLASAADEQRTGNAAEALGQRAASTCTTLATELASAVNSMAVTRDNIASQVTELQEQRAAEQQIVELLTSQREALQADVVRLQATFEQVESELSTSRAQALELKAAQARGRERLLEAVLSAARSELTSMGTELDAGTDALCGRLREASQLVTVAGESASRAQNSSAGLGEEVVTVATEWSKGVNKKCGAIVGAQERSRQAAVAVEAAGDAAADDLGVLQAMGAEWGRKCEQVGQLIDKATLQRETLQGELDRVRPAWAVARDQAKAATLRWRKGGQEACEAIGRGLEDCAAATKELAVLQQDVQVECASAAQQAEAWERENRHQATALAQVSDLAEKAARMEREAEHRREGAVSKLSEGAGNLSFSVTQASVAAGTIQVAAKAELEAMPSDFTHSSAALENAAGALQELVGRAESTCDDVVEGIASLRTAHGKVAHAACDIAVAAANDAAVAAQAGRAAASEQHAATIAAAEHMRACFIRPQTECGSAVAAMTSAADAARDMVSASARTGSEKVLAELEKSTKAREGAEASTKDLAAGVARAFRDRQSACREGLARAPLAAFWDDGIGGQGHLPEGEKVVPQLPSAARRSDLAVPQKPSEEQLAVEFRSMKECPGSVISSLKENQDAIAHAAKGQAPGVGAGAKIALPAGAGTHRTVLGLVNNGMD